MKRIEKAEAVNCLIAGMSITATAEKLGLTRKTIYNWLEDVNFVAVLEKEAQKLQTVARLRNLKLIELAQDQIERSVNDDSGVIKTRTALSVLKVLSRTIHIEETKTKIKKQNKSKA